MFKKANLLKAIAFKLCFKIKHHYVENDFV